MKRNFVLLFTLCAIPALLQAAAPIDPQQAGQDPDFIMPKLINAASIGDADKVQRLLDAGADVNTAGPNDFTALMIAAGEGYKDVVEVLLQVEGIDVNAANLYGRTALMYAAVKRHKDVVEMLLQVEGIDVNAADKYGNTALIFAADEGHKDIVETLLAAGANKDLQNNERKTAEQRARDRGFQDIADFIRDYESSGRLTKSAGKR